MPTATELAAAFDASIDALQPTLAAAREADEVGVAGVLEQAIEDLRGRRAQARTADLLTRWTAERAVKTLTDAGVAEARLTRAGTARVDLPGDTLLDVIPAASAEDLPHGEDPPSGYLILHRTDDDRRPFARYRAADNPKLVERVQSLLEAVVA